MLGRHARVAKWRLMVALAPPLRNRQVHLHAAVFVLSSDEFDS